MRWGPGGFHGVGAHMSCLLTHSACSTAIGSTSHCPRRSRMPLRREERATRRRPAAQVGRRLRRPTGPRRRRAGRSEAL
eukprot:9559733-Alexandrium_andersonii.AAC.1